VTVPPLTSELLRACRVVYTKKNLLREKKFISPSPPFYVLRYTGSTNSVLLYLLLGTNLLGPKHSPASVASYTPILTAWRRITKACTVSFSLLVALQSSLIVLLQVPLKNSLIFGIKQAILVQNGVLGGIYWLTWQYSTVGTVRCSVYGRS